MGIPCMIISAVSLVTVMGMVCVPSSSLASERWNGAHGRPYGVSFRCLCENACMPVMISMRRRS